MVSEITETSSPTPTYTQNPTSDSQSIQTTFVHLNGATKPTENKVTSRNLSQKQSNWTLTILNPKTDSVSISNASVAQTGSNSSISKAFSCSLPYSSGPRIIDLGDSDHTTCQSHFFPYLHSLSTT